MESKVTAFGEFLKRHRLASGISQESLAERARMSAAAVSALERGARRAPYRETVSLLSDALGLSSAARAELEGAAERARGRQPQAGADSSASHNLPTRLTSFVGRDEEIAELQELLSEHRLVTVTGSGGVGKTRTAVEVARRYLSEQREEVWFVDLAPVSDGAFVAGAIATALDFAPASVADPLPSIAARLKTRHFLLILDNCEHIINDAATAVRTILHRCPDITILATSRERLAIEGERVYRMPSLSVPAKVPATAEEALTCASFQLFIERAIAVNSRFTLTADRLRAGAEICLRLEGIPLAIELAATRLPALGFDALNHRLKEHFVIDGGARDLPRRQQTMLATIDWSYELLSAHERVLMRRLSIFQGGLILEAAAAVCADDTLPADLVPDLIARLIDKSLLTVTIVNEQTRYVLLESVRAFALRKLSEAGEKTRIARAHAAWLATVSDLADARYREVSNGRWLRAFGAEIDNVRSALAWTLSDGTDEDALLAARIIGGLRGLWISTAMFHRHPECRGWIKAAESRIDVTSNPLIAARLTLAQVQTIEWRDEFLVAWERARPLFEQVFDRRFLSLMHARFADEYSYIGNFEKAEQSLAQAFAIGAADGGRRSPHYLLLLETRCFVHVRANRLAEARNDLADAALLREALGEDDLGNHLMWSAFIEFGDGNASGAAELFAAHVEQLRAQTRSPWSALLHLAAARLVLGEVDAAVAAAREALELARFEPQLAWPAIWHLATLAALRGKPHTAARLFGFAKATSRLQNNGNEVSERSSYEILMTSLRTQLSADAIAALTTEGERLDFESAVDEALAFS